jgi:hypothetical protein
LQTIGIVLILCGAYLIYETLHSRMGSAQSSGSSSSGGGGSAGGSSSSSSSQPDSGQHQAIDLTGGVTGNVGGVYTINTPYGGMTDQQKDDANAFAHQIGNVGP